MPKFTCEVDTSTKDVKFFIDGQQMEAYEFSIGHYTDMTCCAEDGESAKKMCYISITQGDKSNRYSHSISFSVGRDDEYVETYSRTTIAKDIAKAVKRLFAQVALSKALTKKSK